MIDQKQKDAALTINVQNIKSMNLQAKEETRITAFYLCFAKFCRP